jgi:Bacterial DNA-binding protein
LQLNPKTLEKIKIPAKTVLKFRVAKAAKDANSGSQKGVGIQGAGSGTTVAVK